MASQILHTLFGEDAVSPFFADIISNKTLRPFFSLGCQGPDVFYHSRRLRPVALEYGTLMHRRGYGHFVVELLRSCLSMNSPRLLVYTLGFAAHPFLDRAVHPYVIYKSGWFDPSKKESVRFIGAHAFLERIIDALMLELLRNLEPRLWDQKKMLYEPCSNPDPMLLEVLEKALIAAYPERAGKDLYLSHRLRNAFADAASFYYRTDPGKKMHKQLEVEPGRLRDMMTVVYPEIIPLDVDYLNLARDTWLHPCTGVVHRDSVPDLYHSALTKPQNFFKGLSSALGSKAVTLDVIEDCIGNQGLSIMDIQGKLCAPLYTDPFPLDRFLELQCQRHMVRCKYSDPC